MHEVERTIARNNSPETEAAHEVACGRDPLTGRALPGPTHIPPLIRHTDGVHPRKLRNAAQLAREETPAGFMIEQQRRNHAARVRRSGNGREEQREQNQDEE